MRCWSSGANGGAGRDLRWRLLSHLMRAASNLMAPLMARPTAARLIFVDRRDLTITILNLRAGGTVAACIALDIPAEVQPW